MPSGAPREWFCEVGVAVLPRTPKIFLSDGGFWPIHTLELHLRVCYFDLNLISRLGVGRRGNNQRFGGLEVRGGSSLILATW